jgi:hypothetical protein
MSLQGISLGKVAIILITSGVAYLCVAYLCICHFRLSNTRYLFFAPNITEETQLIIKEQGTCTVQAEDDMPRTIVDCPYDVGDTISITYKREHPHIATNIWLGTSIQLA